MRLRRDTLYRQMFRHLPAKKRRVRFFLTQRRPIYFYSFFGDGNNPRP